MISLSTRTTVPSPRARHIAVSFLWTYKGCRHAPRMFILDQNSLYSFFLIPEFFLWASCPWHNHFCLTQVTNGEQKQKTHSCLSPSSSEPSLPWPEWRPTSTPAPAYVDHPAFLSLAQHSLQWCCLWRKMAGQNCSWQEMSRRNLGKEETFYEHNPIHVLQTVLLSLLLAHDQTQSKSVSPSVPGIALCLHLGSGRKTVVFKMYLVQCNACHEVFVSRFLSGELLGVYQT